MVDSSPGTFVVASTHLWAVAVASLELHTSGRGFLTDAGASLRVERTDILETWA